MATMQVQVQRAATSEKNRHLKQWQNGTVAAMSNQTPSWMSLDRYKNWAGKPSTGSFPCTIAPNGYATANFTHLTGGQFGSVAGVQYSGLNATNVKCAWLLAWQAPVQDSPPCPPNRVYVACGPKRVINAITWDQVVANLDVQATSDSATDSSTKTSADAIIHDLTPGTATLVANFRLFR